MDHTFTLHNLSYTKTLIPNIWCTDLGLITYFGCATILGYMMGFLTLKKTLSWTVFLEPFIVAALFLVICLEVFGTWFNQIIFNWDIFIDNIAIFNTNILSMTKLSPSTNHLLYTKTLMPIYRFTPITLALVVPPFLGKKMYQKFLEGPQTISRSPPDVYRRKLLDINILSLQYKGTWENLAKCGAGLEGTS